MVTTSVELFETDYNPDECKWIGDCPIRIHIWNTAIDDEGLIGSYAFYNSQMEEAKEVVKKHRDVDISFFLLWKTKSVLLLGLLLKLLNIIHIFSFLRSIFKPHKKKETSKYTSTIDIS